MRGRYGGVRSVWRQEPGRRVAEGETDSQTERGREGGREEGGWGVGDDVCVVLQRGHVSCTGIPPHFLLQWQMCTASPHLSSAILRLLIGHAVI
ncbi:hypothetical protein E2C01_003302 [Portunus trituberculatus]|uniref:Uncharacterized protein n=1 Tax=Portunus trituberculatus TaxID=210409 RepID=A0A5B7CT71_PORTR|nr:hypothetical protein [Portunus trituberculatus]